MGGYPSQPGAVPGGLDPNRDFNFAAPGTIGGPQQTMGAFQPPPPQGSNIWDRLMATLGQGKMPTMPGTTIGAPAGGSPPQPPPPFVPQGQMPRPPGIPALQQPPFAPAAAPAGGNNALLAQYMALQQLMRGA
jgi:hypothetical protein